MSCAAPFGVFRRDPPPNVPSAEGELVAVGPDADRYDRRANRINVVFTAGDFDTSQSPLTHDRAIELARTLVSGGGNPARGILERPPFDRHRADFQFWYWRPDDVVSLRRNSGGMCSSAGRIDEVDAQVERALRDLGMGNIIFMNLLNTDCRPQGTWFAINGAEEIESRLPARLADSLNAAAVRDYLVSHFDPRFLTDPALLKDTILGVTDFRRLAQDLFRRFDSPRTYLPIPPAVVSGMRALTPDEVTTFAGHEFGHTFRLWDLYQEDLSGRGDAVPATARVVGLLNRNYDLLEVLQLREVLEDLANSLSISIEIPPVEVNLLQEMIRRPEVAEVLGIPLGWPHCAVTPEEGRGWAQRLGVTDDPARYFTERGCLYFGPNPEEGPNLFYRSSDSIMLLSSSVSANFDPIETAWIEWQIQCTLQSSAPSCNRPPWKR